MRLPRRRMTPDAEARVSRSDFGEEWPLNVDSGTIRAYGREGVGGITFVTDDGLEFAVNGLAMQWGLGLELAPIWSLDPEMGPPARKSVGPLIAYGHSLIGGPTYPAAAER